MPNKTNLDDILDQLRVEYIENSQEKLDGVDSLIGDLTKNDNEEWRKTYIEFQREVHSIKGTAGSYGFKAVTEIAHSLENYLETSDSLGIDQLSDVQRYIDQMRWILESGKNPNDDVVTEILQSLPSPNKTSFSAQQVRDIPVILVMPYNIQRKIIASELASCGFRVAIADNGVRAIELAFTHRPLIMFSNIDVPDISGVELAIIFRSIEATKQVNIALLSSQPASSQIFNNLPEDVKLIRKGEEFSEDLAECLIDWHVFIKEARSSQIRNERSHLRISYDGNVTISKNGKDFGGKTIDISAGGLSIDFGAREQEEALPIERGDRITVDVEGLSAVSGSVTRIAKNNVFVRFDLDQPLEDQLLAEIMLATNDIDLVSGNG
jgi:HPt (histidine-containing phosphotransfer) domain-containing protein